MSNSLPGAADTAKDGHPPTSSNKTSHQSQPRQPPNDQVPLETHPSNSKDRLHHSNPPQKQQPPIEVSGPPPWPTVQPVLAYPAPSNEPALAFPDLSCLPPGSTITVSTTILTGQLADQTKSAPQMNGPPAARSKTKKKCSCSIL
ncbi:hypothetical protein PTKIN_Ptkin16aG0483200 [Pterospermum kingtungense]